MNDKELVQELRGTAQEMSKEILHLKRQLAGSKGRNKQLTEEIKRLKEEVTACDSLIKTMHHKLSEQMHKIDVLSLQNSDYRAMVEWYNDLPWYKKIFISGFETYGD